MPTSDPLFRELLSEGWFVSVVSVAEDRITVQCLMFSRDYDEETGYTDIVFGDTVCEPGSLHCVAKYNGVFEPRPTGPAMLVEQPLPPACKNMPKEMANAIAAFITPANFPQTVEFMLEEQGEPPKDEREARMAAFWLTANKDIEALRLEGDPWSALNLQREVLKELDNWVEPPIEQEDYPEDEDARAAFWASVNQQVSTMTAAGDPWGALKVQREAVNKLIGWVDPAPSPSNSIPEPSIDDMTPPPYSLIEAVYDETKEEEDDYLPVGSHLLSQDFQDFLRKWNQTIAASTGDWLGEPRKAFKKQNPETWQQFQMELKAYSAVYAKEVEEVKAYQAKYQAEEA